MMLRTVYVDILRRPEKEFYRSTLREIFERYDSYAICKGWKKEPEMVQAKQHKKRKKVS